MEEAIDASIKWLESNQEADSAEYKKQKKELEDIVQPIITKLYQQSGAPPPGAGAGGPGDADKDEL
jgi:heat shock protein 5